MKINRLNHMARNTISAEILVLYRILAPFILRTALLYSLGSNYVGLNGLFKSILQILNIADLGVENAIIFSLYQPIVNDDQKSICALLKLYRKYYILIGLFITAAGIIFAPFIPILIQGKIPSELNIYILYLLNLTSTVVSYLAAGYKKCLLKAHMRNDIISKVRLYVSIITNLLQLIAICFYKSYYSYLFILILNLIIENLIDYWISNKIYPGYKPKGQLNLQQQYQFTQRIKDLFTVKISDVILNSADTIVISAFLGLTTLAVYQNYYFILTSILNVITVLFDSALSGIGNSLITESREKNYHDFNMMTFAIMWVTGWFSSCLLCLYQPFIQIWAGKKLMLPFNMVILFICYFIAIVLNRIINVYKDAAGMWHKDRYRPLAAALVNLALNLITVRYIGLYGVLLSSIIALLLIEIPWLLHNIFSMLFDWKYLKSYIKSLIQYLIVITISCILTYVLCSFINYGSLISLFFKAVLCIFIPNLFYLAVYHRKSELKQWIKLINYIK